MGLRSLRGSMWLVLLLALLCPGRAAADAILSVQAVPTSPVAGSSFAVDVNISGALDVIAFQIDLLFDPTLLASTGVSEGGFLPAGGTTAFVPGAIDNVGGAVSSTFDFLLSPVTPGGGVNGAGTLAVINFDALAAGTSALTIANVFLVDSSGIPISLFSISPGSVTITAPVSAVPEPASMLLLAVGLMGVLGARRKLLS